MQRFSDIFAFYKIPIDLEALVLTCMVCCFHVTSLHGRRNPPPPHTHTHTHNSFSNQKFKSLKITTYKSVYSNKA